MDNKRTAFGKAMLETHFPHVARQGVTMLNTGSYGIAPKCVLDQKNRLIEEFEGFADEFVRLRQVGINSANLACLADRLGVRSDQCALIENITIGMSNLLGHLLRIVPSDSDILVNSWTYGAVKLAAAETLAVRGRGGEVREAQFRLPVNSADDLIAAVVEQLDKFPNIRIALFDHITSVTACVMPVKQLTDLCRSRGIKVIIDGAHAIGQIRGLNIEDIGANGYIGNLNKWHFLPKSVALMWVSEDLAESLKPAATSWLVNDSELSVRYFDLGTRDMSSFHVVADAVKFIEDVCGGLDSVQSYCTQLADDASQYLVEAWGTSRLPLPLSMQAPFMRLVKLPEHWQQPEIKQLHKEFRFESRLWRYFAYRLKMDLLVLDVDGSLYIRISSAIIVDMEDVKKLADVMMKLGKDELSVAI